MSAAAVDGLNASVQQFGQCQGPYKHGIRLHVHHIQDLHATWGVTNKNAADTLGDLSFIFGAKGFPEPRGVEQYYDSGIVQTVHLSVSSWGDYLQCNHDDSKPPVYSCKCPKDHKGDCDMSRAGRYNSSHSDYNYWYSFPHSGQGKYWDYEWGKGCQAIEVHASCIIDRLAKDAGCPGICSPKNAAKCVSCVNKLSDLRKEHVWDVAVFGDGSADRKGACEDSRRRRTSTASRGSQRMTEANAVVV